MDSVSLSRNVTASRDSTRRHFLWRMLATAGAAVGGSGTSIGCWSPAEREVVVYAALDREFSARWLKAYANETGETVVPKYDVESTKTVGLVNQILLERARPLCDVFWNNEILHTLRLERAGLLEPYDSPVGIQYPAAFRHPRGMWYGFAARARVLLVNTQRLGDAEGPTSVESLADPRWKGEAGIAKPLFGTTASHAAVLFAQWGRKRAEAFFRSVHGNARTMSGNKQVATSVGAGQLTWGITDTDDAIVEIESGSPVRIIYPDQAEEQPGTLLIPNTLAIIRGCRHPDRARRLLDFLLRPEVERELARGESAQFPLHPHVSERPRVEPTPSPRWQTVDFSLAAESWEQAAQFLKELYQS